MQNFLPNVTPQPEPSRDATDVIDVGETLVVARQSHAKRRWKKSLFVVIAVGIIVLVAIAAFAGSRLIGAMSRLQDSADTAQTALKDGDFIAADDALADAVDAIADAQHGLSLLVFLRPVPWVGTQLVGLGYTLDAGNATITALREAVTIMRNVVEVTARAQALLGITDSNVPYHELSTSARTAMLSALHDAYPEFLQMQVKLRLAVDDIARLKNLHVSPILENAVAPFADLLTPLQQAVDLLTPFSAVIPDLAGLGADRQFLMIFANDTELRPGGGFIGVYGLAVTRDGEIVQMATNDVYSLDHSVSADYHVAAPTPIAAHLGVDGWYFRDSNWSPDFATSTEDGLQLLRQEYASSGQPVPDVHGALMFTPKFISRLLTLIGPVTIDGQTFTPENIADKLEYEVEQGYVGAGIPAHQRKDIVARLTDTVVDRLIALPSSSWPSLFTTLTEGFAAKEVALWSPTEETQAVYVDAGWSGDVSIANADDVLMVVDANLGALKTDTVMEREIAYSIEPTSTGYNATVALTYTNNGSYTWKTTRYQTYTRVYAPLGSTFVNGPQDTLAVDDLGMTSFGTYLTIAPGETRTFTLTYALPRSVTSAVADGSYELRVLKQLGASDNGLTLHLEFPSKVDFATPAEDAAHYNDNAYDISTTLDTDKVFDVNLAK